MSRSHESVGGGDVDDAAPALLFHLGNGGRNAEERRRQVDVQDRIR
jgi:hypothetical protein